MYYPFFRGKQFELLAIRESAQTLADARFVTIIEPVRETFNSLHRALEEIVIKGARASVIINPRHGDHRHGGENLAAYLEENFKGNDAIEPAVLLTGEMDLDEAMSALEPYLERSVTVVHAGFTDGKGLAQRLPTGSFTHVFLDARNTLYRRPFKGGTRILVADGFERKTNREYGRKDRFSDLHVTFDELGADGYGDYLTVGDYYTEGGGPAYAVAIHLTFIDPHQDDEMFIYHFKSDTNDTPVDPAGKFSQALDKLIREIDDPNTLVLETSAVSEFRDLHQRGHFPGLGYVKKLSIKHHIETLAEFHRRS